MKRTFFSTIILVLFCFATFAQDPASIKWKQLKNNHFRVLYPEGNDSMARRTLMMLNKAHKFSSRSLQFKPRRISVLLHNQSSMSNGMVALAPRRSEFWHTPMQESLFPFDWTASLAVHEYRHVVQYDMLRSKGFGRLMFYLMGDYGVGFKSIFSPNWFYEGDAVCTETVLTPAGRGRSANFNMYLKAQVLDKKIYSYSKATLRSYRSFVPNHYILGYNLVAYGRSQWGASLWRDAHARAGSRFFGIRPFSTAIQKKTGFSKEYFYEMALEVMKIQWDNQIKNKPKIEYKPVSTHDNTAWTNYSCPQYINDQELVAIKSGMSNVPTIVKIDASGSEQRLIRIPLSVNAIIHTNRKQIVWDESKPHVRWSEKSYSNIVLYDIATETSRQLTNKAYFYAPCISEDGQRIVAVEVTPRSTYFIVIVTADSGRVLERIPAPDGKFPLTPRWSQDGSSIALVLLGDQGKQLAIIDVNSKKTNYLTLPTFTELANPMIEGEYLVYTSEYNGTSEVYAMDTATRQSYLVTSSRFGAAYPSVYKNTLLFSYYTANGYAIGHQQFRRSLWITSDKVKIFNDTLVRGLLRDDTTRPDFFAHDPSVDSIKSLPFSKISHAVRLHSWGMNINSSSYEKDRSEGDVSLVSTDILSTTQLALGYKYDNLSSRKLYATAMYQGLFPVFSASFEMGHHGFIPRNYTLDSIVEKDERYYQERKVFSQSVSVPLDFSGGAFARQISVSLSNQFQVLGNAFLINGYKSTNPSERRLNSLKGNVDYLTYKVTFSNTMYSPAKSILPDFGQTLNVGFSHGMPQSFRMFSVASRAYALSTLYFPSLIKHHSINLTGGYSNETSAGIIHTTNPVPFARGYELSETESASEMATFMANYTMPLLNPDFNIGSFYYLKRIYTTLFFDYTKRNKYEYQSYGIELDFESYFLNLPVPIVIQPRYSITNEGDMLQFDFKLGI